MPFTCDKYFVKIRRTIRMAPKARTLTRLIMLYMRGSAAEHAVHSDSNLVLDDLKEIVCTCWQNLD